MDAKSYQSGFYVSVTGTIDAVKISGYDNLYIKYSFHHGVDWQILSGVEHAITQISRSSQSSSSALNSIHTFNYPLDISFKSQSVHGWPQLILCLYSITASGADVIRGYACTHLPIQSGKHVKYCHTYRPVNSSLYQRITSYFTNSPPEFFDSSFVAQSKGREVTRVTSADGGVIKCTFHVTTRKMTQFGYQVSGERMTLHQQHFSFNESQPRLTSTTTTAAPLQRQASRRMTDENDANRVNVEDVSSVKNVDYEATAAGIRQRVAAKLAAQSSRPDTAKQQQQPSSSPQLTARGNDTTTIQPLTSSTQSQQPVNAQSQLIQQLSHQQLQPTAAGSPLSPFSSPSFYPSPDQQTTAVTTTATPPQHVLTPTADNFTSPMKQLSQLAPLDSADSTAAAITRISAAGRKTTRLKPLNTSPQQESF